MRYELMLRAMRGYNEVGCARGATNEQVKLRLARPSHPLNLLQRFYIIYVIHFWSDAKEGISREKLYNNH